VPLFLTITLMFHGRFLHLFVPMETGINTLSGNYKICNFTTTVYLHYSTAATLSAVRDDRGRPLPAVRSIEPVVRNLCRKSSIVLHFQFFLGNSLNSLLAENLLNSNRFLIKILSSKLNIRPIVHLHSKHS